MNCLEIMEKITGHLVEGSADENLMNLIQTHRDDCPRCREELAATLRIWEYLQCEAVREMLPEMVELTEEVLKKQQPEFLGHLQSCSDCHDRWNTLRSILAEEKAGVFGLVPAGPTFGDLVRARKKNIDLIWNESKEGVRRLTADLKILISRGTGLFLEMPALLSPYQPVPIALPAKAFRSGDPEARPLVGPEVQELILPVEEGKQNIRITIRVGLKKAVDLLVRMTAAGEEVPLPGVRIILLDRNHRLLETSITTLDNAGTVEFSWMDPDTYFLKISKGGLTWEVPLALSPSPGEIPS